MDIAEEVRAAIGAYVQELSAVRCDARWARVEGLHVTLKFIGEAPAEKVERIRTELDGVRSAAPVEMTFRGTGFFPNARHPRVFWAGIEATPNLAELAKEIDARLETLGIARETRAFHPHLTLARFNSEKGLAALQAAIEKAGAMEFGRVSTGEFHLYESRLQRGGAVYTRLATFPFWQGGP
jgi:2'-5' RNA ligase